MERTVIGLSNGLLVAFLSCAAVWGQASARISGTVKDQASVVLSGAAVNATQTATGIARDTVTNQSGVYVLPNLAIGPYRIAVTLPGYRTFVQSGVVLQVNSDTAVNVVLEAGQEPVQVEARASMVETQASAVGQLIDNERIVELPYGRNANALITLTGAAVQTGTSFSGTPVLNVAGGLGFTTGYRLDGATNVYAYTGQNMPLPFPNVLQEFKVETSGLSAQYGPPATVNFVTKAGTNAFHGDAFEFVRNDRFNARSYFAPTRGTLKRNQYGGTLGGPMVKNRLFFFGGYQGTNLRQDPIDRLAFVPTAAMLAGDFTAFASPACNAGRQITLRAPFVNNRIDPALFGKAAVNIANRLLRQSNPCGQIIFGQRNVSDDHQFVGRVDYQRSDKHSLFGRYTATTIDIPHPFTFTPVNILNASGLGFDDLAQALTVGDTYLISPNTSNAFRLSVNRVADDRTGAQFFGPTDVGINAYSYIPRSLGLSVTGGFSLGVGADSIFRTTTYQASDDVSLLKGAHQMSFGAEIAQSRSNTNSIVAPNIAFNGQQTGLGMADFLMGTPSSFVMSSPNALYVRQWNVGLYAQDSWKLTPRLNLNAGLRWEPFLPQVNADGRVYNFDYDRFRQGIMSTVFKNAPAGFYYPGDSGFPGKSGINKRWLNFGPRLGLAWDVQGNGLTAVRAFYGLSYTQLPLQWRIAAGRTAPWVFQTVVFSPAGGLENPWRDYAGGDPFPRDLNPNATFPSYGSYETTPYNIHTPHVSSWNLSIQRQITPEWLASASYIGSQAVHMWVQKPLNSAIYFPGGPCAFNGFIEDDACSTTANTSQRRRFSLERRQDLIGILDEFDDGGTQSYNGLLLSVQSRASRFVTFDGNYTWSHCIGDFGDTNGAGPLPGSSLQNPNNRDFDRGNCDSDRRHIFDLTVLAQTPQFANPTLRPWAGWKVAGIYRKSSGSFLTMLTGFDRALTGVTGQRPNQVLVDPYRNTTGRPLTQFLNPAAFAQPAVGTLGRMGRANVQGPGTWQFDVALSREFRIRENQRLVFRAEAYNVLNRFRPGAPSTSLSSAIFGQIRTSLDPRTMQFALTYVF